jgi:hypothetical protein
MKCYPIEQCCDECPSFSEWNCGLSFKCIKTGKYIPDPSMIEYEEFPESCPLQECYIEERE